MPKVSIIMPAYNVEQYIRECMDSVVAQTLDDIEIIAIDDGSTDTTGAILDGYAEKDSRIHVVHKENSGYGASMNIGLSKACGEYIGIVETDDFAEKNMFELLYETAKEFDADVVKCNFFKYYSTREPHDEFSENLKDVHPYREPFSPLESPAVFKISSSIWSCLYRRTMIEENGIRFLESPGASYQDTGFAFKTWVCAKKVVCIREPLLHYRQDNNASSINNAKKVFCVCDEFEEIERFLKETPSRMESYEGIMNTVKNLVYLWNYYRLGLEYRYAFLLKMKEELLAADMASKLDRTILSEKQNERLDRVLYRTEEFYEDNKRRTLKGGDNIKAVVRENSRLKKELEKKEKALQSIKDSTAYRIGRAVTAGPRKIKKTFNK